MFIAPGTLLAVMVASLASPIASVRLEGRSVFVNEVPTVVCATESRAESLARALWVAEGTAVSVKLSKHSASLIVGGSVAATIDAGEAKKYGLAPKDVVQTWAARLRSSFALPAVKATRTGVRLGAGAKVAVPLIGASARHANVASSDLGVASASLEGATVTVHGLKPGRVSLTLSVGTTKSTMEVLVMANAVDLPQTLAVSVTGAPASSSTIRGAVRTAVRTQLRRADGTHLKYEVPDVSSIPTGEKRLVRVPFRADRADSIPTQGFVDVTVSNVALSPTKDAELWFSNRPESIPGPGELFWGLLEPNAPIRMLYHHYNKSGSYLFVRLEVLNLSAKPAEVMVIPGDSQPSKNPTLAGLQAADQFARNWVQNSAEIVTIPPGSCLPISTRKLYLKQTMSGLCSMRLLPGGPETLLVRLVATPPFGIDDKWAAGLNSSMPWQEIGLVPMPKVDNAALRTSEHVYGHPFLDREFSYRVGEAPTKFRIGSGEEISKRGTGEKLAGNYGVIYNLRTTIENPTDKPRQVALYMRASGGYAGGLFVIDGTVLRTPLLNPDQEVRITSFRLEPGLRRFMVIQTLPLSGSNYPATLTLRPLDQDATSSTSK